MLELFATVAFSWYAIIGISIWLIILAHIESEGWPVFFVGLLGFCSYKFFNIDPTTGLIAAAAYIPLGIGYSVYRFKRHCSSLVEKSKAGDISKESALHRMMPSNNISNLTDWILTWPFSLIANIFGDIFDAITKLVRVHLIGMYNRIAGGYADQLEK